VKISIVVPAFNEERLIGRTLECVREACAAFDRAGWGWEIVVCDNNSSDATASIASQAGARVVFEPVNQISRARNRGASAADGDWLIFIDADSHPSAGLFEDVVAEIRSDRCVAGGVEIRMRTHRWLGRLFTALWNRVSRWGRWMAGSFIFVETRVFRELGGFSEALFAGEELDLAARLKTVAAARGRRVVILRGHPLVTSGRKMELYGPGEMGRFFLSALMAPRRVLGSRDACGPWYDGRR